MEDRIYPVGRLDKETTGLLLLTNDGTLVNQIIHPSSESEKEYEVTFDVLIPEGALDKLRDGVKLDGEKTLPTHVKKIGPAKIRVILKGRKESPDSTHLSESWIPDQEPQANSY